MTYFSCYISQGIQKTFKQSLLSNKIKIIKKVYEQTLMTEPTLSLFTHFLFLRSSLKKVCKVGDMTITP